MFRILYLIISLVFFTSIASATTDISDTSLNTAQVIKLPIDDKNTFVFVLEERLHQDWEYFDGIIPVFYLDHKLNKHWSIGAGYRTELFKLLNNTEKYSVNHVIYPQVNFRFNIRDLKIGTSLMLEQNLLTHESKTNKWFTNMQIRPRLRFEYPLGSKKKVYIFNSHDIRIYAFNNTQTDKIFNMYRGELGLGYKFNKHLKLEAGYRPRLDIKQNKRDSWEHIFLTRLYITLPKLNKNK